LSRAIQLDAKWAEGFSIQDVRDIARQSGISDAAITTVIEDFRQRRIHGTVEAPTPTYRTNLVTGIAAGAAVGAFFTLARSFGDVGYVAFSGIALIPVLAFAAAMSGSRKHSRFQLLNLAHWLSAMAVWTFARGPTSESSDILFFGGWLASIVPSRAQQSFGFEIELRASTAGAVASSPGSPGTHRFRPTSRRDQVHSLDSSKPADKSYRNLNHAAQAPEVPPRKTSG
jgi:hypothetical protein